jgi:hypothetical protein
MVIKEALKWRLYMARSLLEAATLIQKPRRNPLKVD